VRPEPPENRILVFPGHVNVTPPGKRFQEQMRSFIVHFFHIPSQRPSRLVILQIIKK